MKIIYQKPLVCLSAEDIEAIARTRDLLKELGMEDEDKKIFDYSEDGFNYEELYEAFKLLNDLISASRLDNENENS